MTPAGWQPPGPEGARFWGFLSFSLACVWLAYVFGPAVTELLSQH